MKRTAIALSICFLGASILGNSFAEENPVKTEPAKTEPAKTEPKENEAKIALDTDEKRSSYAIGLNIGRNLFKDNLNLDLNYLLLGLKDMQEKKEPRLTNDEIRAIFQALQEAAQSGAAKRNLEQGKAFLEENKKKEGVTVLPSGLQYKIIKEGAGAIPKATDTVTTHYRGTLVSGQEFDSSYKRGQPASFPVNKVIKGWTEALQLMKTGGKWQLFIPADLAYGPKQTGQHIGPNSTLIFDIELISINK